MMFLKSFEIFVNEGISTLLKNKDTKIKKYINKSNNINELILNIKTKRYTYNKISRMLNHILIGFTKENNSKIIQQNNVKEEEIY